MDTTLIIFAVIFGIVGVIGCVLPMIPGPPLSWAGLLLISLSDKFGAQYDSKMVITWAIITLVVMALDYVVPILFTKGFGGSKDATRGATIGLLVGLFMGPAGIILGPFFGALIGELINNSSRRTHALKVAFGSFISFLLTTELKLIASCLMLWHICKTPIEMLFN
jgi:uncharacterized protein YqgC (DUF456 family)